MVAQQVAAKATRDALFLSSFGASELPKAMLAASLTAIAVALWVSRAVARYGPGKVTPALFVLSAAMFVVEWSWLEAAPRPVTVVLYLHTTALGAIAISGFWSVLNERFDPHAGKRVMARVGAGAAFGGVLGGLFARYVTDVFDLRTALLGLTAINLACALVLWPIHRGTPLRPVMVNPSGLGKPDVVRSTPYLRDLALLVGASSAMTALIDYSLKAEAAANYTETDALLNFFALFYTVTSVLAFLVQSFASRPVLGMLGLAGTVALLPVAGLGFGLLSLAVPKLWTRVLLGGADEVISSSLFRSGYEPLYTPLSPDRKRASKVVIDVAVRRLGAAFGSVAALLALMLLPEHALSWVLVVAVMLAAALLWVARRLHRGYVNALADSLRTGAVSLDLDEVVDGTTMRTLSDTAQALDRASLVAQISALRAGQSERPLSIPTTSAELGVAEATVELLSGDETRVLSVLRARPLDARLVGLVLPLLDEDRYARPAVHGLRGIAPSIAGQLEDALLDPERSSAVRRRVARVLKHCPTQRAVEGLTLALKDPDYGVRRAVVEALSALLKANQELTISEPAVLAAVLAELQDPASKDAGHVRLEHAFTMLGLVRDRETLQLCRSALKSQDPTLRGTSMEYLENVLPEPLLRALWPRLGPPATPSKPPRSPEQLAKELHESVRMFQAPPKSGN